MPFGVASTASGPLYPIEGYARATFGIATNPLLHSTTDAVTVADRYRLSTESNYTYNDTTRDPGYSRTHNDCGGYTWYTDAGVARYSSTRYFYGSTTADSWSSTHTFTVDTFGQTERGTSGYSHPVNTTTTSLLTEEQIGTVTYTREELVVSADASGTVYGTRGVTDVQLDADGTHVVTVSRTVPTSTTVTVVASTNRHAIIVQFPGAGEHLYSVPQADYSDERSVTWRSWAPATVPSTYNDLDVTEITFTGTAPLTRTGTAVSLLTATTALSSLVPITTTITSQRTTSAGGGLYTTYTRTIRHSSVGVVARTLTTGISTVTSSNLSTGTSVVSTLETWGLSYPTTSTMSIHSLRPTLYVAGNTTLGALTLDTRMTTYSARVWVPSWSFPGFSAFGWNTSSGATNSMRFTAPIPTTGLRWATALPGAALVAGTVHGAGAFTYDTLFRLTNAGQGLTGLPELYVAAHAMFSTAGALAQTGSTPVPISLHTTQLVTESTTYRASTSMGSVSLTRRESSASETTSFAWAYVLSTVPTGFAVVGAIGVNSATEYTVLVNDMVALQWRSANSIVGLDSRIDNELLVASTIGPQLRALALPLARKTGIGAWSYCRTGDNNQLLPP